MARRRTHQDVQYEVYEASGRFAHHFDTFDEAAGYAVVESSSQGVVIPVDVLVFSKAGARFYGGDDAVEQYEEDPEASIFERIEIKATYRGRIA